MRYSLILILRLFVCLLELAEALKRTCAVFLVVLHAHVIAWGVSCVAFIARTDRLCCTRLTQPRAQEVNHCVCNALRETD